jgi:hypothetical protein
MATGMPIPLLCFISSTTSGARIEVNTAPHKVPIPYQTPLKPPRYELLVMDGAAGSTVGSRFSSLGVTDGPTGFEVRGSAVFAIGATCLTKLLIVSFGGLSRAGLEAFA